MSRPIRNRFSLMTRKELLDYVRMIHRKQGIKGMSYPRLSRERGLYMALYNKGIGQKRLLNILGLEKVFKAHKVRTWTYSRGNKIYLRWTWKRIVREVQAAIRQTGFLPPASWFVANGNGALVTALYKLGKRWADLYDEFKVPNKSAFFQSRNGLRWRSRSEASLSNFFYARGIKHTLGRKYPEDYAAYAKKAYGYYDLAFWDRKGRLVDVEIWGDKPFGHNEEEYKRVRQAKTIYNFFSDGLFIGVHFTDCYNEGRLTKRFKRFIGTVRPFKFSRPYDREIQSVHWSNADELIAYCREFARKQPGGKFPTEEWLRKRGKWRNRPGPAYNTVSIYIRTWLGGIRNLRKHIGQSKNSTRSWDRKTLIESLRRWYARYEVAPGTVRSRFRRGKGKYSRKEYREAAALEAALLKYVGSNRMVHRLLVKSAIDRKQ
jgi:hypothetical protein